MPPVRRINHHKTGIDVDFSIPVDGAKEIEKGRWRLSLPKEQLDTQAKADAALQTLDLHNDDKYGFHVEALPDVASSLGRTLEIRDVVPEPVELPISLEDETPHNTPVAVDGFESQDFGLWKAVVSGQAEVQNGTIIDGNWTGHFGYAGGGGSDQGGCASYLYASTGATASKTRTYTIFRARIAAWADADSGHTAICNHTQTTSWPSLDITEDGKLQVTSNSATDTGTEQLSLNTDYWFGFYMEFSSGAMPILGWVVGRVWNGTTGALIEEVGWPNTGSTTELAAASWTDLHIMVGANNTPLEMYADSVLCDDGAAWPELVWVSKAIYPTGNSATDNAWPTIVGAATKPLTVDDPKDGTVDDATTYNEVSQTTTALRQGFTHCGYSTGGIPANATIQAVALWNRWRKTAGTVGFCTTQMRVGANLQESAAGQNTAWAWLSPLLRSTHPDGNAWNTKTLTNFDALEIGINAYDAAFDHTEQVTCCHLQVAYTIAAAGFAHSQVVMTT